MSGSGALACFVVSAVSYVPFIGVALWILPPRGPEPSAQIRTSMFRDLRAILRIAPVRRSLLTVLVTTVFCSPLLVFSPVLVRDSFHGTAGQFSAAVAMFGVGGLSGAAVLLAIGAGVDRSRLASIFAIVYGALVLLAALTPWWWALPVLFVLAGAAMTICNTSANTVLQVMADPSMLGETVGLYLLVLSTGLSIGAVFTGATVSAFGIRRALIVNGLAAIAAQAAIVWTRRMAGPDSDRTELDRT
jgi:predicted MFS family arabinose efflux permease